MNLGSTWVNSGLRLSSKELAQDQVSSLIEELGLERYAKTIQKAMDRSQISVTKPGQILLDHSLSQFRTYLDEWVALSAHTSGPKHHALKYIKMLKADVISLLVCQLIIDNISISTNMQSIALQIANALEDEVKFNIVRRTLPEEWKTLKRRYKYGHEGHKRKVIKAAIGRMEVDHEPWGIKDKYALGYLLIDFFVLCTGLVTIVSPWDARQRKKKSYLRPT